MGGGGTVWGGGPSSKHDKVTFIVDEDYNVSIIRDKERETRKDAESHTERR